MIKLIIGLFATMLANILLGTTLAKLKQNFTKKKCLDGIVKVLSLIISISLMYLTSYLNPDILVANINGTNVNLISGIEALCITGIIMYGSQDLIKLKDILKLKTDISNEKEKPTVKIPVENIIKGGE